MDPHTLGSILVISGCTVLVFVVALALMLWKQQ